MMLGFGATCVQSRIAWAGGTVFEDFKVSPETRWAFFTDTVMGGVSTGQVSFQTEGGRSFARLQGDVSTENRGGFIQFRRALPDNLPQGTRGIRLVVRGNSQRYFVHLRGTRTVLPWQYYQAGFDVGTRWSEVRLDLGEFQPSGRLLPKRLQPQIMTSIGIVAYGRDHMAQLDVSQIDLY